MISDPAGNLIKNTVSSKIHNFFNKRGIVNVYHKLNRILLNKIDKTDASASKAISIIAATHRMIEYEDSF